MAVEVVTGNQAAGQAFCLAGEANRMARGAVCGIYPITPQTEIVETVAKFSFSRGKVIPVESEHSAMGVCIGASVAGARSFTASSSNGLAYMTENILVAGYYRLPIVMAAVNRALGPPWNIWADQGDTLLLRDAAWIQLYCESNQEILDSILIGFRLAEDRRILLPVMVIMDAFIVSHTAMETDIPTQAKVDKYLPPCEVPHRLDYRAPVTIGGMTGPLETVSQRMEIDETMAKIPAVYEEHRQAFETQFGRSVDGALSCYETADAEIILIASATIATTAREVVRSRRESGERIGLIKIKMYRPFPEEELRKACRPAKKLAVLDRNYGAGVGGIFYMDVKASLQGHRDHLIQNYLTGVGGTDVTPSVIHEIIDDMNSRVRAERPIWKGIE